MLIRSDLYRGVMDALNTDEPVRNLGQPVILAASYHGGDRHMAKCYQVKCSFNICYANLSTMVTRGGRYHYAI